MFVTIAMIIFLVVLFLVDLLINRNLRVDLDTEAVINLRRKMRFDIILFALLIFYTGYRGYTNGSYTGITIGLSGFALLLLIKIGYFNPNRIVITDTFLKLSITKLPLDMIDNFTVLPNGKLLITFKNTAKTLSFQPRDPADYERIVYCVEKLGIGGSGDIIKARRLGKLGGYLRGVVPLVGQIKDYAWGGEHYISNLIRQKPAKAAELWFGTHINGPSFVRLDYARLNPLLEQVKQKDPNFANVTLEKDKPVLVLLSFLLESGLPLNRDPKTIEQQEVALEVEGVTPPNSDGNLPWLFKILDVERPLSIQIHPDRETAQRGFAMEEEEGIDISDPKRNFKDPNPKPELAVALTEFYTLYGFAHKENILKKLEDKPLLAKFKEIVAANDLQETYRKVMSMNEAELQDIFGEHIQTCVDLYGELIDKQLETPDIVNDHIVIDGLDSRAVCLEPDYWIAFCFKSLKMNLEELDPGLACFYLFNLIRLEKYQGIFQGANTPHAYLRGRNFECMTQSDNVIRGGLTPKYINKELLLKLTDCTSIDPEIFEKDEYFVPVDDFKAGIQNIEGQEDMYFDNGTIVFLLDGEMSIKFTDELGEQRTYKAQRGNSFFVTADTSIAVDGKAEIITTTC